MMSAIIIREPWITKILSGEKTWEMRSKLTTKRGLIGLIRKRSGHVIGVAQLTDTRGPFSPSELTDHFQFHRVPNSEFGDPPKWTAAWVLRDAVALQRPIKYKHKRGSVIWVCLEPAVEEAIRAQLL